MADSLADALAYLAVHLPSRIPLRLDVARQVTDAEGWLRWARRVVAAEEGGYALGVGRESVVEVYEAVKERAGRGGSDHGGDSG